MLEVEKEQRDVVLLALLGGLVRPAGVLNEQGAGEPLRDESMVLAKFIVSHI